MRAHSFCTTPMRGRAAATPAEHPWRISFHGRTVPDATGGRSWAARERTARLLRDANRRAETVAGETLPRTLRGNQNRSHLSLSHLGELHLFACPLSGRHD